MDLLLTTTNDLDLINNRIKLTATSTDLIRQRMQLTLHVNQGEWQFNTAFGLPWMTAGKLPQLIGKNDKSYVDSIIKDKIRKIEGVKDILTYTTTLDQTTRLYAIKGTVALIDNTTVEIFEELEL